MSHYVDGFVIPIPEKELANYQRISRKAGKIWKEYGALDYKECVGDDLVAKDMVSFTQLAGAKKGEVVIFSWIVFKSKAHRDKVNAKVIADPRLSKMMTGEMPFDCKRMAYGGFKTIVEI